MGLGPDTCNTDCGEYRNTGAIKLCICEKICGVFRPYEAKFFEDTQAAKTAGVQEPTGADHALACIKGLYTVEKDLREQVKEKKITLEVLLDKRRSRCTPILQSFHQWLEAQLVTVLPSSALGTAVKYALN
jgi:hypothetical protein